MLWHYNSRLYDAFITPQGIINFMAMDAMDSQSLSDCWLWHIIFMSFCSPLRSLGGLLMWCIKLYSMHANTWKQWSKESQIKHVTIFTYHTPQLRLSLRDTCHNFRGNFNIGTRYIPIWLLFINTYFFHTIPIPLFPFGMFWIGMIFPLVFQNILLRYHTIRTSFIYVVN